MGQDLHKHSKVSGSYESLHMNRINKLKWKSSSSKFTEKELQNLIKLFHNLAALSPQNNYLTRNTFEHYFPLGGLLAKRLFVAFDADKDGLLNLQEFLDGMELCLQGSVDDKYKIAFKMFDIDGTNGVSQWELHLVLKSVLATASRLLEANQNQCELTNVELDCLAHSIVQDAFKQQQADLNGENKMTMKVFKSWMEKHPFVLDSIFEQSCLKDKNMQYARFGSEYTLVRVPEDGLSAVKKQTWVESTDEEDIYKTTSMLDPSYGTANYLWSPVFVKTNHSKPSKRCKLAACLVYDSIYIYGGRGICNSLKDMWRYDVGENTWFSVEERGANRPSYLQEHTMVAYKDSLVVFGGEFTAALNETPLWFFNLHTLSWSQPSAKQKGPANRRGHTAVISGEDMYIFGGYIDLRGASRELWKYEFSSNTWSKEKIQSREWPSARYCHSAAVFEKSMVVFGGLEEMHCKNDMWLWNMASCKWTRIKGKNSPPPLFGHSAVKVGDGMLVFGGESTDGTLFNSLWRFDFDSRSWNTIKPKGMISPSVRSHQALVQIPNFIFSSRRPTSSHSAPPCTPGHYRELPQLEEENESTFDNENIAKLTSAVSLGSLDSTALLSQTEEEAAKIKLYPTGSLDSLLITTKALRETENMSNYNRTCLSNEALVSASDSQEDSYKEKNRQPLLTTTQLKPTQSTGQRLAAPSLKLQLKPYSANYLSAMTCNGVHPGSLSVDDAVQQSSIVNIMVLGGSSRRGIESVDRWIDMWKCQIDPNKQTKSVKRIEVQATPTNTASQYDSKASYDSKVTYVNFSVSDTAADNDYYDDSDEGNATITDCVLMDVSEGDTSTDLLVVGETAGRSQSLAPVST